MESNDEDFLKTKLKEGNMSILLGAGFSRGAINQYQCKVYAGLDLSNALYDQFYRRTPYIEDDDYNAKAKDISDDLLRLCSLIASEGRREARDNFLQNVFTGCVPAGDKTQEKLVQYPWKRIFTLNIDDLVENIFEGAGYELNKWNMSVHNPIMPGQQVLIKLHGDVEDHYAGYVFDDEEYTQFIVQENCLLKEFSQIFTSSNMILLGTEFSERDLEYILSVYKSAGYSTNGYEYFFITPEINNLKLQNKIKNTGNFHWIKMNTSKFMNFLAINVVDVQENYRIMKENGAVFIDEISRNPAYTSQIYSGRYTQYNDFFGNWDVRYPGQPKLVIEAIEQKLPTIITLYGKPYVGKTTVARRILIDLYEKGFVAVAFTHCNRSVLESITNYLNQLEENSKIAILFEDAAYQYDAIVDFLILGAKPAKIILITTDTLENHISKYHLLTEETKKIKWYDFPVSEKMTTNYIGSTFYTLVIKHRLNRFLSIIPERTSPLKTRSQNMIFDKMKKINDIIEVLYYSSEGMYFKKHYEYIIKNCEMNFYYGYIVSLCILSNLGVSQVPTICVSHLVPEQSPKFSEEDFLKAYPDLLEERNGFTRLLRRIILSNILPVTDKNIVYNTIKNLVIYIVDLFEEDDGSIYYEIFQKILRVKRIRDNSMLPKKMLLSLFEELESRCKHISYFCVEYGLATQQVGDYATARNHFLYARGIRPNSYQVRHALAKNKMESSFELLKAKNADADIKFTDGCREMSELINDRDYTRAFSYSVHTYAMLLMRYYGYKECPMPKKYLLELQQYFETIIHSASRSGCIDAKLQKVIFRYINYCKDIEFPQYSKSLHQVFHLKALNVSDDEFVSSDVKHVKTFF